MLRASLGFFVIALLAIVLGASNIAGLSLEMGKILLVVFLALSVLSLAQEGARKRINDIFVSAKSALMPSEK